MGHFGKTKIDTKSHDHFIRMTNCQIMYFPDCKFKLYKRELQRFTDPIIKFQTKNDLLVTSTATLIARSSLKGYR